MFRKLNERRLCDNSFLLWLGICGRVIVFFSKKGDLPRLLEGIRVLRLI